MKSAAGIPFGSGGSVMDQTQLLQGIIDRARKIVFFGGAGVSTESGIPDFRSRDGLYRMQYEYPPEEILSHAFFMENPQEFYRFYYDKILDIEAYPGIAHRVLAQMERVGKLIGIVTQNIDGLHRDAGSRNVSELHGSVKRNHCMKCGKFYTRGQIKVMRPVPYCTCGGLIKPDVVLYQEPLDEIVWSAAQDAVEEADVMIVGGTSLAVYPAAGLVNAFDGTLVVINKDPTPADGQADLVIQGRKIGSVLQKLVL